MIKVKVLRIIDFLIEATILTLIFLLPLYFSFFYKPLATFMLNVALDRTVVFKILVEVLLYLSLIKIALEKKIKLNTKLNYLLIPLPYLVILIIATIFSIDPHTSFWGSYWRQQGLLTFFYYFLFFTLILINIRERKQVERIINVILLTSFFVILFGILQWLHFDFLFRQPKIELDERISSTLGQPVFFGNYLLLTILLPLYKVLKEKGLVARLSYGLLFLLQIFSLAISFSRGAWLGLAAGLLFGFLFYLFLYKKKKLYYWSLAGILSFFIIAVVFIGYRSSQIKLSDMMHLSLAERFKSAAAVNSGSAAMRIKYWSGALDAFITKPLLGYGPETQRLALIKYYDPTWLVFEDIGSFADRAHNEFFDILMVGGIAGLLSFSAIIVLVLFLATKKLREKPQNGLLIFFLTTSLIAYLGGLFFSFSTVETNVYFWLYLALLFLLFSEFKGGPGLSREKIKKIYYYLLLYALVIAGLFLFLLARGHYYELRADYYFQQAKINYKNKDYASMINNYLTSIKLNDREEFYRAAYLVDTINSGAINLLKEDQASIKLIDYLEPAVEADNRLSDNYFRSMRRAVILTNYGKFRGEDYFTEAEQIYKKLMQVNPYIPDIYRNLSLLYVEKKEYQKAIEALNEVLRILPESDNPNVNNLRRAKINQYASEIYIGLGRSYCTIDETDKCLASYAKAVRLNPRRTETYKILADLYRLQKNFDQAVWYNLKGSEYEPNNFYWYFSLARLYRDQGENKQAAEYAKQALGLSDGNQEIINFLEKL